MNYIIFDLEWNQCPEGKENENPALPFEIIEIGAIKTNSLFEEISRFREKIRPSVYSSFHYHTRELLQADAGDFQNARSFPEVVRDFLAFCETGSEVYFCTWGPSDLLELQRNLAFYSIKNPFPFPLFYLDIQKLYSRQCDDVHSRKSLECAIEELVLPKTRGFHNALDDALYTLEIMRHLEPEQMLSYYSVDYFRTPKSRRSEILIQYDSYQKFISKPFASKIDAMHDPKVTSTRCYLCGKPAKKKIRWFTGNSKNYYSLSYCEEHGWLKGKARLRKTEDGRFFCIKTLKLVQAPEAQEIANKKAMLKK